MLQTKLSAVVSRSQGHSPEAEGCPALGEVIVFLSYFDDHLDARQAGKVRYPLDEVLFMYLLAALAGAETPRSKIPCAVSIQAELEPKAQIGAAEVTPRNVILCDSGRRHESKVARNRLDPLDQKGAVIA